MHLSFIWHMHQPDYRDASGIMQMPWVFLHAIKDYYDMPWMMARHENIKATFNITPPLIEQLKLYYDTPEAHDYFLALWLKEMTQLGEKERQWMIKICKSVNYDTMVVPLEGYDDLYKLTHYSDNDLFDMQVLFVLSWCGVYLRQNSSVVATLIKKGRAFNIEDKYILLHELSTFIQTIFDYYIQLHAQGRIALSTTPLNHPILPLLMDMENANIAHPGTAIPKNHQPLQEDARLQITRAQTMFKETFGFDATGFWPAEGAVDAKSVALLKECGIKWIATDEAILFKSLHDNTRANLYAPYDYNGMRMGFRDHGLSDLIGFTYQFWDSKKAADHFMQALAPIQKEQPDATVFVILDGENAWEFYKNNAFEFFDALYDAINTIPWCHSVHMDELLNFKAKTLEQLRPGSWIHGEFNTWVGHNEKTRGWELIFMTRHDYDHHAAPLDDTTKEEILRHFLAAECSDWFWWYGDDHYTDFGSEFDILFRSHLISIYDLMHVAPPSDLFEPIIGNKSAHDFWLPPQSHISPVTNGIHDSFFEWVGCGVLDESKLFSTMDRVRGPVHKILYGQDMQRVYFAFVSDMKHLCQCDSINIIIEPLAFQTQIALDDFCDKTHHYMEFEMLDINVACDQWLELCIDKSRIDPRRITFRFELEQNGIILQTLPGFGELEMDLETDYSENWFV
jgi:alpha-amylase/alpha-mannosidase (GH57 family)